MRAADLLGTEVVDQRGRRLGRVHDIRLTRPAGEDRWRIDTLIVGTRAIAHRFGYADRVVEGPALLAALARLTGHRHEIPWHHVLSHGDGRLVVRAQPDRNTA